MPLHAYSGATLTLNLSGRSTAIKRSPQSSGGRMKNENKLLTSGARYSAYGKAGGALGVVSAELMFFCTLNIVLNIQKCCFRSSESKMQSMQEAVGSWGSMVPRMCGKKNLCGNKFQARTTLHILNSSNSSSIASFQCTPCPFLLTCKLARCRFLRTHTGPPACARNMLYMWKANSGHRYVFTPHKCAHEDTK